ncbi:unnamed protein product [Caenorhabditis sp. 36 PRJEB53466]|nr:unnamed protein product [Caenorhabditis sp. 36 PRJEB53466]
MQYFKMPLLFCFLLFIVVILPSQTAAQDQNEESFFRLQKSGRPVMKAFMNRFPYHNPMFTLREQGGRQHPFSGF